MLKRFAGAFSFAHLIGPSTTKSRLKQGAAEPGAGAVAEVEGEEEESTEAEAAAAAPSADKPGAKAKPAPKEDDDEEASAGENDGDEDEDEDEDEEEEAEAETTDGEKGGEKGGKKKGKSAAKSGAKPKAANGEFKRGRKAERRRVGLILSNPAASNNIGLALKLACNTGMSSSAAIALLEATPAARRGNLDRQMQDSKIPDVKAGGPEKPKGEAEVAASWDHAYKPFHDK